MNKKFEELSPLERAIIGIEKRRWKYQGSKEKTIGALGITPIAYYQKLNTMIDDPRVIAAEPILTARLREHRSSSVLAALSTAPNEGRRAPAVRQIN